MWNIWKKTNPLASEISPHALAGFSNPQTIKFTGWCKNRPVTVLWDCGSSHNFIQSRIVPLLGLTEIPCPPFKVKTGGGQTLNCSSMCQDIRITLQGYTFLVDFFVLLIEGTELVMGVQWMQLLGSVVTNYKDYTIQFTWQGSQVILTGEISCQNAPVTAKQMKKTSSR